MDRNELTLAIAGALIGAVLLGWILRGVFGAINRSTGPRSIRRTAELAAKLHTAEGAQAEAELRLRAVESDLGQRLAEVQAELETALEALEGERRQNDEIRAAYRRSVSERDESA